MSACTDGPSTIRLREMKRADMPAIILLERELFLLSRRNFLERASNKWQTARKQIPKSHA